MILDDVKADETYKKIKSRARDRECCRNLMPRTCFQAEHQWWIVIVLCHCRPGSNRQSMRRQVFDLEEFYYIQYKNSWNIFKNFKTIYFIGLPLFLFYIGWYLSTLKPNLYRPAVISTFTFINKKNWYQFPPIFNNFFLVISTFSCLSFQPSFISM